MSRFLDLLAIAAIVGPLWWLMERAIARKQGRR